MGYGCTSRYDSKLRMGEVRWSGATVILIHFLKQSFTLAIRARGQATTTRPAVKPTTTALDNSLLLPASCVCFSYFMLPGSASTSAAVCQTAAQPKVVSPYDCSS